MLRPGTYLANRYEIGDRIGSGGTSDVYRAKDLKLSRSVAIKVLKSEYNSDRSFVQKFRTEAQNAAKLSHQNIVNVYDVGEEQDIHYIVMELVEGITLKSYIDKKVRLSSRETIGIAIQVAQGIEMAHSEHIVHRDIKPQNVIISRDGKVKVTDFGIARAASSQTISSNAMGSVHYISPEQARGGYCDERSDIYSLGITMYEMVTGRVPYEGESTVAVALQHIQGEAYAPSEYAPDIYSSLECIIEKCMQKKPEYRYESVTALIADLKRSLVSPDEDFVKIAAVTAARPTRVITEDEIAEINAAAEEADEQAYLMGDEPEEYYDEEEYYDDYEEEEDDDDYPVGAYARDRRESGRRFEKIMVGAGVGVAVLVVVLALVVLGNVFHWFSGDSAQETAYEMEMPDIVDYEYADAVRVLEQNNISYTVESDSDPNYDSGHVTRTDPRAGETVRSDETVTIYVNSTEVTIPTGQIIGVNGSAAQRILQNLGLNVVIEEEENDEVEAGKVISCDPDEGTELNMGDTVTLHVSKAPEDQGVQVPSVVGAGADSAAASIRAEGLTCNVIEENSDTVGEGYVIRTNPEAGTSVESGSNVTLYVSVGPETREVPNVVGQDQNSAETAIRNAGLTVHTSFENSATVPSGQVIRQTPSGGGSLNSGSSVAIVVSQGAAPTEAPQPEQGGEQPEGGENAE